MSSDPPVAPSLEDTVLCLQEFWSRHGCLRLPAGAVEVPYAILHPDAFFRILGAAPWRAAWLQWLRRPLDARNGEHPYRLIRFLQLQVVLKPPPADVAGLFRESLRAAGLELELHDLRFVEAAWQPASLGASGDAWHALLDGLGIARLSYFERLAGHDLEPASCEISYGLERLSMVLRGAASVLALPDPDGDDDGARRRRDELELSRYVIEVADSADLRQTLAPLERAAESCLEAGLARPAYELAVRYLEPLDILDARGDLTARERSVLLQTVRQRMATAADLHQLPPKNPEHGGKRRPPGRKKAAAKRAAAPKTRRRRNAKGPRRKPKPPPARGAEDGE